MVVFYHMLCESCFCLCDVCWCIYNFVYICFVSAHSFFEVVRSHSYIDSFAVVARSTINNVMLIIRGNWIFDRS